MKNIIEILNDKYGGEDHLTKSMMTRAIQDLGITDPSLLDVIYESVMFYTEDFPEHEGWGSSDSRICVASVKDAVESHLKHKEASCQI